MVGDVQDETQIDVDEEGAKTTDSDDDVTDDDTASEQDVDEKPLDGAKAREFVEGILDEYGLDSADDLKEFIGSLSGLQGKIGDRDLDQILKNSETLEKYQEHWATQEREKKKESETPEETISRLEKENEDLQDKRRKESDQRKQAKDAQNAIEVFNDTVSGTISADKAIPKEYRPFLAEFMGVDNPINEIDIENKAEVRKLTKAGIKKLQAFEQLIIKRYRDGKIEIPKVSTTHDTTPSDKKTEPKTLKDARRILHESISGMLGKK